MPNRADYTNALVQEIAQQELARRQPRAANTTGRPDYGLDKGRRARIAQGFEVKGSMKEAMDKKLGTWRAKNRLVDQMALPDASQPFTRPGPPPPMPGVGDFQLPQQLEPLNELGRTMDPDVLPVEALTPEPEPASAGLVDMLAQFLGVERDKVEDKGEDRGERIQRMSEWLGNRGDAPPWLVMELLRLPKEEFDRKYNAMFENFERGEYTTQ